MNALIQKALLAGFIVLIAACTRTEPVAQKFSLVDITGSPWGRDFQLTDHQGTARTLADFRGKAVIMTFGYTHCPDMCPMTLHKLSTALTQMGKDAEKVQVLFVTLDPNRDTPKVLKQYAPAFHPTFLGMYADEPTTQRTAKEFKVYVKQQPADTSGFYTVDHMGPSFVFDPQGRLRLFISDEHSVDMLVQDLRTLLKG